MRIGVYLCQAGVGDPEAINLHSLASYAENLPDVHVVRDLGTLPKLIPAVLAKEIKVESLDRIVIAGDSPGFFKPAFTVAMAQAGGDPEEVRLASFREFGARLHDADQFARFRGIGRGRIRDRTGRQHGNKHNQGDSSHDIARIFKPLCGLLFSPDPAEGWKRGVRSHIKHGFGGNESARGPG